MHTKKPYWLCWIFSGHYNYGWQPSLFEHTKKYFREKWWKAGYSYFNFIGNPFNSPSKNII